LASDNPPTAGGPFFIAVKCPVFFKKRNVLIFS